MQKPPSFSATKEEICDVQNEPIVKKLFEDAIKVLRLAGAHEKDTQPDLTSPKVSHQDFQQESRRAKKQLEQNNGKQAKKPAAITKSKRRKLERVKAPVTVLRKMKQVKVPSEEEQEGAVQRMLNYIHQMPFQETFQPPALPCVSFTSDEANEQDNATNDGPDSSQSIQDYTYLSNDKDIALWKMLVASPSNCNVFVGGLDGGVTSEILHTAFEAFCLTEEDKAKIKTRVVMDVVRHQSKGYGFVSFPCRRAAELAMMCMQDFEVYGHAMQLGWGKENRDEQPFKTECSRESKISQQQYGKESLMILAKPKGDIVSDTVYSADKKEFQPKPALKRRSSRWDQKPSKRHKKIEESVKLDQSQDNPKQENKEGSSLSEMRYPILLHSEQFGGKDSTSVLEESTISEPLSVNLRSKTQQAEDKIVLLHENELNCSPAVSARNQLSVNLGDKTDFAKIASHSSLDRKGTHSEKRTFSSPFGEGQDPNGIGLTESGGGIETRRTLADGQHTLCEKASCSGDQNPRKAIQWLTHDQKVSMIKSVCSKLRGCEVRGHLGVFGIHYQADNSRLYVVCAKHVTQTQLLDEFKVFGTAEVKLNCDINGFSKGCAFVQYKDSANAERAIKQLHGKVVGSMPLKVMVAEPKFRKGSWEKKTVM